MICIPVLIQLPAIQPVSGWVAKQDGDCSTVSKMISDFSYMVGTLKDIDASRLVNPNLPKLQPNLG